jgi:hypothetical protein
MDPDYWLSIFSFGIAAVAVLGKTRDENQTGLAAVRPLGVVVLILGVAVLIASIAKNNGALQTKAKQEQASAGLQQELSETKGSLDEANKQIFGLETMQGTFNQLQQDMGITVSEAKALDAQQRSERESLNATALRATLDNSFCSLRLPYRQQNDGSDLENVNDFMDANFIRYLHQYDLNIRLDDDFMSDFNGQPMVKAIDFISSKTLQDLDRQIQASLAYLPKNVIEQTLSYRNKLSKVLDLRGHANNQAENRKHPAHPIPLYFLDDLSEEDYRALFGDARALDRRLAKLSGDDSSQTFALSNCSE